jgi:hypothetical protein
MKTWELLRLIPIWIRPARPFQIHADLYTQESRQIGISVLRFYPVTQDGSNDFDLATVLLKIERKVSRYQSDQIWNNYFVTPIWNYDITPIP